MTGSVGDREGCGKKERERGESRTTEKTSCKVKEKDLERCRQFQA